MHDSLEGRSQFLPELTYLGPVVYLLIPRDGDLSLHLYNRLCLFQKTMAGLMLSEFIVDGNEVVEVGQIRLFRFFVFLFLQNVKKNATEKLQMGETGGVKDEGMGGVLDHDLSAIFVVKGVRLSFTETELRTK